MARFFLFLVLLWGFVANNNTFAQAEEEGEVIFIRPQNIQGWAVRAKIFMDEKRIAKLKNGRTLKYKAKTGKHFVAWQFYGRRQYRHTNLLPIQIETGKTKYVALFFSSGWWRNNFYAIEITEPAAYMLMSRTQTQTTTGVRKQ